MWEKMVLNLLSNAFKFTLEGSVLVRLRVVGNDVQLSVTDTGTGIPEEELPRVFERFHRVESSQGRTFEGTGIGLALVRELARLHGGTVDVTSSLARGSTFTLTIPLGNDHLPANRIQEQPTLRPSCAFWRDLRRRGSALAAAGSGAPAETRRSPCCHHWPLLLGAQTASQRELIVLADDNADMRDYVTHLLREKYRVHAVCDGREAVEATRRLHPDLVLTDVMMPVLDGRGRVDRMIFLKRMLRNGEYVGRRHATGRSHRLRLCAVKEILTSSLVPAPSFCGSQRTSPRRSASARASQSRRRSGARRAGTTARRRGRGESPERPRIAPRSRLAPQQEPRAMRRESPERAGALGSPRGRALVPLESADSTANACSWPIATTPAFPLARALGARTRGGGLGRARTFGQVIRTSSGSRPLRSACTFMPLSQLGLRSRSELLQLFASGSTEDSARAFRRSGESRDGATAKPVVQLPQPTNAKPPPLAPPPGLEALTFAANGEELLPVSFPVGRSRPPLDLSTAERAVVAGVLAGMQPRHRHPARRVRQHGAQSSLQPFSTSSMSVRAGSSSASAATPEARCIALAAGVVISQSARRARVAPSDQRHTDIRGVDRSRPSTTGRPLNMKRRDIFLKIERIADYSPLAPILCARIRARLYVEPRPRTGPHPPDGILACVARRSRLSRIPRPLLQRSQHGEDRGRGRQRAAVGSSDPRRCALRAPR